MAMMKRAYGGVQPCIKAGVFRIRIPFIHFNGNYGCLLGNP